MKRDGHTKSTWQEQIQASIHYDEQPQSPVAVTIIGGGITGITTALLLQEAGFKCLVLEAKHIGYGTTGGTTAHINTFFDTTYPEIEQKFSANAAKLVADLGKMALEQIDTLVQRFNIDCQLDYKTGYLFAETEDQVSQLEDILDCSKKAGINVASAQTNGLPLSFLKSIAFADQAQFHPINYVNALTDEFIKAGGEILTDTFVNSVDEDDYGVTVHTSNGIFKAQHAVYATHIPPGINQFSFKCAPYRSYVLGVKLEDESQYPDCLSYDMQEPYHYWRTHEVNGEKIMIFGGADHKTGHDDPEAALADLKAYVSQSFEVKEIAYQWSSQYYVPVDGLPYIGSISEKQRILVATGYNGNGMTWGTIAGILIRDILQDQSNAFTELLNPNRLKPMASITEFIKENADVAYHFIADRFHSETVDDFAEVEIGEGKIVDYEGKKLAVYRDEEGKVTALEPTCTHAGCIVNFNPLEKTWDCPCHGGRFDTNGNVITGPPQKNLQQVS